MATLVIRRLDARTMRQLQLRATRHGRSVEEEASDILRSAVRVSQPAQENLADSIHRRFAAFGGVELEIPPRGRS